MAEHPLVHCRATREPVIGKGRFQSLDLRNVRTLYAAFDRDRGSFVATYKKEHDISLVWRANLASAQENGLVSEKGATTLLNLFEAFEQSYRAAMAGFVADGLVCGELLKQAGQYGALLHAVCNEAKGDRNREKLLRPLLEIGNVAVEGGRVTAIVAPWHPLRLTAMASAASICAATRTDSFPAPPVRRSVRTSWPWLRPSIPGRKSFHGPDSANSF